MHACMHSSCITLFFQQWILSTSTSTKRFMQQHHQTCIIIILAPPIQYIFDLIPERIQTTTILHHFTFPFLCRVKSQGCDKTKMTLWRHSFTKESKEYTRALARILIYAAWAVVYTITHFIRTTESWRKSQRKIKLLRKRMTEMKLAKVK